MTNDHKVIVGGPSPIHKQEFNPHQQSSTGAQITTEWEEPCIPPDEWELNVHG